jgi:hypothetical protein
MRSSWKGFLLASVLALVAATAVRAQQPYTQFLTAIQHLEPKQRERAIQAWSATARHQKLRDRLIASSQKLETDVQTPWKGMLIGGAVTGLPVAIYAASKLKGLMRWYWWVPAAAVAGGAIAAATAKFVNHINHVNATDGGYGAKSMRFFGWTGGGFEGDLQRLEVDIAEADHQPRPQHLPWNAFRLLPGGRPQPRPITGTGDGHTTVPSPAVTPAPSRGWNPFSRFPGASRRQDPNTEDLPNR